MGQYPPCLLDSGDNTRCCLRSPEVRASFILRSVPASFHHLFLRGVIPNSFILSIRQTFGWHCTQTRTSSLRCRCSMAARSHCVFSILTRQYLWTSWSSSCPTASVCRTCHTTTNTMSCRRRSPAGSGRTQQHTQSGWCRTFLAAGHRISECCGYTHALGMLSIIYLCEAMLALITVSVRLLMWNCVQLPRAVKSNHQRSCATVGG